MVVFFELEQYSSFVSVCITKSSFSILDVIFFILIFFNTPASIVDYG